MRTSLPVPVLEVRYCRKKQKRETISNIEEAQVSQYLGIQGPRRLSDPNRLDWSARLVMGRSEVGTANKFPKSQPALVHVQVQCPVGVVRRFKHAFDSLAFGRFFLIPFLFLLQSASHDGCANLDAGAAVA